MLDFKNNIKQCLRFNDSVEVERHSYNFYYYLDCGLTITEKKIVKFDL